MPDAPGTERPVDRFLLRATLYLSFPAFILGWHLLSTSGLVNRILTPTPGDVVQAIVTGIGNGMILLDVAWSVSRVVVGYLLGAVLGIAAGLLTARYQFINNLLSPTLQTLRPIPPIAIVPLTIIWFGLTEGAKYFLVAWGVFFVVWIATFMGVQRINPLLIRAAQSLGRAAETDAARGDLSRRAPVHRGRAQDFGHHRVLLARGRGGRRRIRRRCVPGQHRSPEHADGTHDRLPVRAGRDLGRRRLRLQQDCAPRGVLAVTAVGTHGRTGNISLRDVQVEFGAGASRVRAIERVSLDIPSGEFAALLGPSGCGKSTLLNVVAGFIAPTQGSAALDGKAIVAPGSERGVVFQQPALFPWKTVRQNIALGPRMAGLSRREVDDITGHFMELVGLNQFADHYPDALSGGMQQRVGIARALANNPSVLLMDEPFGSLDAQTRELMQENLLRIWDRNRTTVLFVTHDIDEAVYLADRVVLMSARPASLIADIIVELKRPRNPEVLDTAEFLDVKKTCRDLIREESIKAFEEQNRAAA